MEVDAKENKNEIDLSDLWKSVNQAETLAELYSYCSKYHAYVPALAEHVRGKTRYWEEDACVATGGVIRLDLLVWHLKKGVDANVNSQLVSKFLFLGEYVSSGDKQSAQRLWTLIKAPQQRHKRRDLEPQGVPDDWVPIVDSLCTSVETVAVFSGVSGGKEKITLRQALDRLTALVPSRTLETDGCAGLAFEQVEEAWKLASQILLLDSATQCALRALTWNRDLSTVRMRDWNSRATILSSRDSAIAFARCANESAESAIWTAATLFLAVCGIAYRPFHGSFPMVLVPRLPPQPSATSSVNEYAQSRVPLLHDSRVWYAVLHTVATLQRLGTTSLLKEPQRDRVLAPIFDLERFVFQRFVNNAHALLATLYTQRTLEPLQPAITGDDAEIGPAYKALPWSYAPLVSTFAPLQNTDAKNTEKHVRGNLYSAMQRLTVWCDRVRIALECSELGGAHLASWWPKDPDSSQTRLKRAFTRQKEISMQGSSMDQTTDVDLVNAHGTAWMSVEIYSGFNAFDSGVVKEADQERSMRAVTEARDLVVRYLASKQLHGLYGLIQPPDAKQQVMTDAFVVL